MSQWYYASKRMQMGPVEFAELQDLAATGLLRPTDLVWTEGMADWALADSVPSLMPPAKPVPVEEALPRQDEDEIYKPVSSRRFETDEDEPGYRPRRDGFEDDEDVYPLRRPRAKSGSTKILVWALVIGGGFFLLGILLMVILVASQMVAESKPIPLVAGPIRLNNRLTFTDGADPQQPRHYCKIFTYPMVAGKLYIIDLESDDFDAFLRLEDPNGRALAEDDDGGIGTNSRIVFRATQTGAFRIIATTFEPNTLGDFVLKITP